MKQIKQIVVFLVVVFLIVNVEGCGKKEKGKANKDNTSQEILSEENFEWDGNIIVGLTEQGTMQEEIVIPARCEGFDGMIFADVKNEIKSVRFESDKNILLNGVFGGAEKIERIVLPKELETIDSMEFWLCSSLKTITIPENVDEIGAYAFQDNESLEEIIFEGDNVSKICAHAFEGCVSLNTVNLPNLLTAIEEYAFYGCDEFKKVEIYQDTMEIGAFAFANSGLEEVYFSKDVVLGKYDATSFAQSNHSVTVFVESGSWIDSNFDNVFNGAFEKEYISK